MLTAFAFTVAIIALNYLLMGGWVSLFSSSNLWRPVFTQLIAMAFLLVVSAYFVQLDIPTIWVLLVAAVVGIPGFVLATRQQKLSLKEPAALKKKSFWIVLIAPLSFLFLETRDLFSSQFSYRIGPDNLGWATASSYLCRGGNFSGLTESVQNQLGDSNLLQSFLRPLPPGVFSINRISSYTDQAASEFLIGAHRTGGPGLVASICEVVGTNLFASVFISFIGWAVLLVALIVRAYALEKGLKELPAAIISVVVALNVNLLSVTLEGGFGQTLTLPYFLIAVVWISRKNFQFFAWTAVLALLIAVAATTYLDVLYIAIPFLGFSLILRALFWRDIRFAFDKRIIFVWAAMLIALIPISPHLYRLVLSPISNPTHGGWNQGNFPLPNNLFGFASRLPQGLTTFLEPRTPLEWVYDIGSTLLLVGLFVLTLRKISIPFLPTIAAYGFLVYSVYFSNALVMNNYRIWKFSEYAAVFFGIVLVDVLSRYVGNERKLFTESHNNRTFPRPQLVVTAVVVLLLMQASTSVSWAIDWKSSSRITLSQNGAEILKPMLDKYDLEVICGAYPTQYSILGDLHYAGPNRGAGLVKRSDPPRLFAYLTPGDSKETRECLNAYLANHKEEKISFAERNAEFQVVVVESVKK